MKIFGKRKAPPTDEPPVIVPPANVPSYFAESTAKNPSKKQRKETVNGEDMEALLRMDPAELNSKQRRLLKRHQQRTQEDDAEATPMDHDNNPAEPPKDTEKHGILTELQGLNSKHRRKLLRDLKRTDANEDTLKLAEEAARRIALQNTDAHAAPPKDAQPKAAPVLPPEEMARRDRQRELQKEAAVKRAEGGVGKHRHALNSERRRANRRKPKWRKGGREFNEVGYRMRRG